MSKGIGCLYVQGMIPFGVFDRVCGGQRGRPMGGVPGVSTFGDQKVTFTPMGSTRSWLRGYDPYGMATGLTVFTACCRGRGAS